MAASPTDYDTGRRILNLQTSLAIIHSPMGTRTQSLPDKTDKRRPFTHPALAGLANLSDTPVTSVLEIKRLADLATRMGMRDVVRWKPRVVSCTTGVLLSLD